MDACFRERVRNYVFHVYVIRESINLAFEKFSPLICKLFPVPVLHVRSRQGQEGNNRRCDYLHRY